MEKTFEKKGKGQSPLIGHTLMLIFTIFLVVIVIVSLNMIRDNYQKTSGQEELEQLCGIIKNGVEKIYLPERYQSPTDSTLGKIVVNLPDNILDLNYRMEFINNSLKIEAEFLNITCKIGFDVSYNGSSFGRTEIKWIRLSNGTDIIDIKKV